MANNEEIMCALVSRMFSDNIYVDSQWANEETIARKAAVQRSDEGRAKELLADMATMSESPVVMTGAGMFALRRDKEAISRFLERVCPEQSDIPWELS